LGFGVWVCMFVVWGLGFGLVRLRLVRLRLVRPQACKASGL